MWSKSRVIITAIRVCLFFAWDARASAQLLRTTRFRRVDTWKVCETKARRVGRDGSAPPKQRRRIIIIKRAVKVWTMWKLNIVTSETSCCCDVTADSKQSSATAVVVLGSSRHGGRVYCLAVCILRCRSVSGEQVKQWKWRRFQVRCPLLLRSSWGVEMRGLRSRNNALCKKYRYAKYVNKAMLPVKHFLSHWLKLIFLIYPFVYEPLKTGNTNYKMYSLHILQYNIINL